MILKIFTQPNCSKCFSAKELGKRIKKHLPVEFWNVEEAVGLAEASFYSVYSTPSLILVNDEGKELAGWRAEITSAEEDFLGAIAQTRTLARTIRKPLPKDFGKQMIQIKYWFPKNKEEWLRKKVIQYGGIFVGKFEEEDLILQPYGTKFVDRGVFLRLRKTKNLKTSKEIQRLMLRTFEYKEKMETREAIEFDLDKNEKGAGNLLQILQSLKAVIGTNVEKEFELFEKKINEETVYLRIDKINGIPSKIFLEISTYCRKGKLPECEKIIKSFQKKLNLSEKNIITQPYCRLIRKGAIWKSKRNSSPETESALSFSKVQVRVT